MSATERPVVGTGEVQPLPDRIAFRGWITYRPDDPQPTAYLHVVPEGSSVKAYRAEPVEGYVTRPVVLTIRLDG